LQGFADEVLKLAKKVDQDKKLKESNCDFLEVHKEVIYMYGELDSYDSRRKQNHTTQEVMAVGSATLEYLKWSKVSITFD
jgi:hypothetical protein